MLVYSYHLPHQIVIWDNYARQLPVHRVQVHLCASGTLLTFLIEQLIHVRQLTIDYFIK